MPESDFKTEYARERQPLFRFYDARNEFFKDSLEHLICQNELYLSSRKNFNDPFDVNPVLKCDWTPAEIPRHAEKLLSNPLSASDPVAAVQRMFSAGIVGKKAALSKGNIDSLRNSFLIHMNEMLDRMGICCFTEEMQNPIFWSHYAGS